MKYQTLACICTSLLLITACSLLPQQLEKNGEKQPAAATPTTNIDTKNTLITNTNLADKKQKKAVIYKPFSTDTLFSLLTAELAATRKQYNVTLANYIREAKATNDLGIITRAARLAQYFRSYEQSLAMGHLWLKQSPNSIEANSIITSAHIQLQQPLQALDYAEKILAQIKSQESAANNNASNSKTNNNRLANNRAAITETIVNYSRNTDTLTRQTLIERYHQLAKHYPNYPTIKVGLSTLYELHNDTVSAYDIIQEALAVDNDYLPAIIQEINLLQINKQTQLAIDKLKIYREKAPSSSAHRLHLLYARLLAQTDINAAYIEFTRLSEQSPEQLDIKFSRALIALELRKRKEAEQLLAELLDLQYRPNTVRFYLGSVAETDKDYDNALRYYLAVKEGADHIPALSRAAHIMAITGKLDQAQAHLRKLREDSPNNKPQLYSVEAEVLESIDEIDLAITAMTNGITEFPNNINLRYYRSSLYEKADKLALMENDLRHIITLEPQNAAALNALGYFLTSRTNRHQEALGLIRQALEIKPNDPAIMDSMGWALFNLGKTEIAIKHLRKAFELFPDPEVAAHLGEALWTNGNKKEALTIWTNNLKDNPGDKRILETMQRLQAKHQDTPQNELKDHTHPKNRSKEPAKAS